LIAAALAAVAFTGCTAARHLTTKRLSFTENLLPSRNHNSSYSTGTTDTGGPIGPLPFDIQITGDVRNKYDKFHGGVDYAYLTYKAVNSGSAPVRIRLWANLAGTLDECPPILNGQPPVEAEVILDVTLPAHSTTDNYAAPASNSEELRKIVQALLEQPDRAAACVYTQAESTDPNGNVTILDLNVKGRAHGSLF
jgi:hypothetical protein